MKILLLSLALVMGACSSNPKSSSSKKSQAKTKKAKASKEKVARKQVEKPVSPKRYESTKDQMTCSLNNDVRSLTHSKLDSGGCVVDYEKFGESRQVAKASSDLAYCGTVMDRIRNNLEKAGFSCE